MSGRPRQKRAEWLQDKADFRKKVADAYEWMRDRGDTPSEINENMKERWGLTPQRVWAFTKHLTRAKGDYKNWRDKNG